jgi:hypothetical protein
MSRIQLYSHHRLHSLKQCLRIRIGFKRIRIWIRIQHFRSMRIKIQGFHKQSEKNSCFLIIKKLQFTGTYPKASVEDNRAIREAFSPQKRTSSTSELKFSSLFSNFWGHFCPPGSRSGSTLPMRIRIQPTKINADPDPKHWPESQGIFSLDDMPILIPIKHHSILVRLR